MANLFNSLPLTAAILLMTAGAASAQTSPAVSDPNPVAVQAAPADAGQTRAEMAFHPAGDARIADLPAGHWATNATQVVIANNVLTLQDGAFNGNAMLTSDELNAAMSSLTSIAEVVAGKGNNIALRAAIGQPRAATGPITRIELAQSLASFLDSAASQQLVAIAAPNHDATRFKDLGAAVPPSVMTTVDKYKVMTGYPDNTFRASLPVTRYQMAAIALNIINQMKTAPLAMLPVKAAVVAPPVVIVVHDKPDAPIAVAEGPKVRANFRQRSPYHLDWQAVNSANLTPGAGAFSAIPLSAMFTGYQGPVMLQNVTNVRVNLYTDNMVDSEFRVGLSTLKYGMFQAIPYVGANVGVGTSIPTSGTQYDTYVGGTYGAILSIVPTDNIEVFADFGQAALLGAGRFNSAFQATTYPNALGSILSNYQVGADFYVANNICLSVGLSQWQNPAALRTGTDDNASGVISTLGGTVGVGSTF